MENKAELTKELEQLKSRIAELEKSINEPTKERTGVVTEHLKIGDKVWNIVVIGNKTNVESACWIIEDNSDLTFANTMKSIGHLFWDEESCQKELDRRLFLQEYFAKVKQLNKKYDWVADWSNGSQSKYCFLLRNNIIDTDIWKITKYQPTQYYFCCNAIQELKNHFKDRLKLLFE
jgi:hypothetical protein